MSDVQQSPEVMDEQLVAYLDGELSLDARQALDQLLVDSPELRRRLEDLRGGERPFREAFDLLMQQAPVERMSAALAGIPEPPRTATTAPAVPRDWRGVAAAAMVLLALGIGFVVGVVGHAPEVAEVAPPAATAAKGWRQAVADYQVLFVTESLTPDQGGRAGVELVSQRVGLALGGVATSRDGLEFRRAQLLEFNGKPLAQIAYLAHGKVPVAFCVIRSANPDTPRAFEVRNGLGIVHWVAGGYGFMLIGDIEEARLARLADSLEADVRL